MNLEVPSDLLPGLTREANARGVSVDTLAAVLLRTAVEDKLVDAIIDDELTLPRVIEDRRRRHRVSGAERKRLVLRAIDASPTGEVSMKELGGAEHNWRTAVRSLLRAGTIKFERRDTPEGYARQYYSRRAAS